MHNADTHSVLYIADPKLAPQMYSDRGADFTITAHHANGHMHKEVLRLEAAFVADPTNWRVARDYLWACIDDLEDYAPEAEFGSVVSSAGFLPTGRILVTQGRALPEFAEVHTSASYSAFCLAHTDGGWDCSEYTGTVLRAVGLNGMGFPSEDFGGPVDDIGAEDPYSWQDTVETVTVPAP